MSKVKAGKRGRHYQKDAEEGVKYVGECDAYLEKKKKKGEREKDITSLQKPTVLAIIAAGGYQKPEMGLQFLGEGKKHNVLRTHCWGGEG